MKKAKILSGVVFLFSASVSLTSCLDSDSEDYSITPEQYTQYLEQMAGTYHGKMYFWNDTITTTETKTSKLDSLQNVTVSVRGKNDSTITVSVPAKYLGKNIKNSDENKALKDAVDAYADQTLKMKFYLYQLQNSVVYFGIYPTEITTLNLNYGGADHKMDISWYSYYNYNGTFSSRYMDLSFYMTEIKVDGTSVWKANTNTSNADEYYNPHYTFTLAR